MKFIVGTHSVIDLITNSSTEMFIDFSGSINPLKELINEVFKMSGIEKTCDDVFKMTIVPDWAEDDVEEWEIVKDTWKDDGYAMTVLQIETKDESFNHLAKLIQKFLDSMDTSEYAC